MTPENVAGLGLGGGKKDNFFICILEHFSDQNRWFVKSVLHASDMVGKDGNEVMKDLTDNYRIKEIVLDFPLSNPPCHFCELECPGAENCPVEEVIIVKHLIKELLETDKNLHQRSPKKYEQMRNEADLVNFGLDILTKNPNEHLLTRSFKRRLKKDFLPYWNRPLDVWVWFYYHDHLLELFNETFDSFSNASLMLIARFAYLKRHFSKDLQLFETSGRLCLIELLRSKIISRNHIMDLKDIQLGPIARLNIIKRIEEKLDVFIYDHDKELIAQNPKAFQSFILAVVGQRIKQNKIYEIPPWAQLSDNQFCIPKFS